MPEAAVVTGEDRIPTGRLLFETDGRRSHSTFLYDPSWLDRPDGFDLSPGIPRSTTPYHASSGGATGSGMDALAGPFADASPDSWGRRVMRSAYGESLTEFDYLVHLDDFSRQGALRFLDIKGSTLPARSFETPKISDLKELRNLTARFELERELPEGDALRLAEATGSLGGARPKVNVVEGASLWVAKFTSVKDTWPVERLEVATLHLAKLVGLRAPTARLELSQGDQPIALFERFDRKGDARIPYMSARTALGKEGTDPGYYTDIGDVLRNLSPNPGGDLRELWLRMIFGILVTNTDDHLKNHGLLRDANGSWRLSPVFDVNPQPRRQPGMETGISPIHGFEPSVAAAINAAPLFDIDEVEARNLARDAAEKIRGEWRNTLRKHGLAGSAISACAPAFEHERSEAALSL